MALCGMPAAEVRLRKIDPETGKVVQEWPLQADSSYDNIISYDGKHWARQRAGELGQYGRDAGH